MGKPSKQQVAEARKRGIVPGARIKCASGIGGGILRPSGDWTSENEGFHDGVNWCVLNNVWASVIAAPSKPTQPRIKGRFAAKPKEPTQLDRIEGYLNKVGQAVVDQGREFKSRLSAIESGVAVIRSGATFMQQLERDAPSMRELIQAELRPISDRIDALRMEQSALAQDTAIDPLMNNGIVDPQPASLRPGDYCDASKEVADELTAMGFKWADGDRTKHPYILPVQPINGCRDMMVNMGKSPTGWTATHLDAPTFLSRARVTAKELGLKPVEAPAELNVGDWVEVIAPAGASDIIGCDRYRGTIAQVEPWSTCATKEKAFHIRSIDCWFRASSLRKLSEAEIAAHLAAEEAKRKEAERAAKVKALKFGVRVMTPEGSEGVYINTPAVGGCRIAFPSGHVRNYTLDQLTIL
jgi:hypothetical protein